MTVYMFTSSNKTNQPVRRGRLQVGPVEDSVDLSADPTDCSCSCPSLAAVAVAEEALAVLHHLHLDHHHYPMLLVRQHHRRLHIRFLRRHLEVHPNQLQQ